MTQTQPDTSRPNPSDITTKTTVDTANSAKVDKSTLVRKGDIYATAHDDAVTKMGSGSDSNALTAGPPEGYRCQERESRRYDDDDRRYGF